MRLLLHGLLLQQYLVARVRSRPLAATLGLEDAMWRLQSLFSSCSCDIHVQVSFASGMPPPPHPMGSADGGCGRKRRRCAFAAT